MIDQLPEREDANAGFRVSRHLGNNAEAGKPGRRCSSALLAPNRGIAKAWLKVEVDAIQPTGRTDSDAALADRSCGDGYSRGCSGRRRMA